MRFSDLRTSTQVLLCRIISPLFPVGDDLLAYSRSVGTNPLLPLGRYSEWDGAYASWASVVREDASWRMYYSGKDNAGHLRIGLALSQDGLKWTKYKNNPILGVGMPGSWDSVYVYCPIVWRDTGAWKMMFTGCDSQYSHFQLGLASSSDGVNWEKSKRNPVFSSCNSWTLNSHGKHETEGWGLLFDGHEYSLLYNPVMRRPRQIGLATSEDLLSWKERPDPILPSKGLPWQLGYMKYCAHIFKSNEGIYLLYAVSNMNYSKSRIGLSRLSSLKDARNMQFLGYVADTSSSWCRKEVDTPFVVRDAAHGRILCYYGGRSERNEWHEGSISIDLEALNK